MPFSFLLSHRTVILSATKNLYFPLFFRCLTLPSRRICYPLGMSVRVSDPGEQKGLQTPASTPSDFEIRWDEHNSIKNYPF